MGEGVGDVVGQVDGGVEVGPENHCALLLPFCPGVGEGWRTNVYYMEIFQVSLTVNDQ